MLGFQSVIHQGWFAAKIGKTSNPYPQFVKNRGGEGFQTSAWSEYERGVRLFHDGKSWKPGSEATSAPQFAD